MSRATFFLRDCPTCGRRLQIRVEYMGRSVCCKHCAARFKADDPSQPELVPGLEDSLLERANRLLESCDAPPHRPR